MQIIQGKITGLQWSIIRQNHWTLKYRSLQPIILIRSILASHLLIIQHWKTLQDKKQIYWTMKSRSLRPTFICKINLCVALTHYLEVWRAFKTKGKIIEPWTICHHHLPVIMRSKIKSHSLIIPKMIFDNQIVFKIWGSHYRSLWPTIVMRSITASHWFIMP